MIMFQQIIYNKLYKKNKFIVYYLFIKFGLYGGLVYILFGFIITFFSRSNLSTSSGIISRITWGLLILFKNIYNNINIVIIYII